VHAVKIAENAFLAFEMLQKSVRAMMVVITHIYSRPRNA
jgi:hypothetical protein